MKQVDKAKFSSDTDMVNLTEADKVFEGTFAGTETGWIQITLDKAFEFDGNSNLLVAFYDPTEGIRLRRWSDGTDGRYQVDTLRAYSPHQWNPTPYRSLYWCHIIQGYRQS